MLNICVYVNVSDRLINVNRRAYLTHKHILNLGLQHSAPEHIFTQTHVRKASRIHRVKGFARFINLLLPHPSAHTDYDQIITFKFLELKVCNKLWYGTFTLMCVYGTVAICFFFFLLKIKKTNFKKEICFFFVDHVPSILANFRISSWSIFTYISSAYGRVQLGLYVWIKTQNIVK